MLVIRSGDESTARPGDRILRRTQAVKNKMSVRTRLHRLNGREVTGKSECDACAIQRFAGRRTHNCSRDAIRPAALLLGLQLRTVDTKQNGRASGPHPEAKLFGNQHGLSSHCVAASAGTTSRSTFVVPFGSRVIDCPLPVYASSAFESRYSRSRGRSSARTRYVPG